MAKSVKKNVLKTEDKTEVMNFRVTQKEREIIECHAEKEGFTVAQYLRIAVLMDMSLSGDIEAMKIVFSSVRESLKDSLRSKLLYFEASKSELA